VAALARAPGATATTFDGWMAYLLPWACESEHLDTPLQRAAVIALTSLLAIDSAAGRTTTAHRWLAQMLRRCVRARQNYACSFCFLHDIIAPSIVEWSAVRLGMLIECAAATDARRSLPLEEAGLPYDVDLCIDGTGGPSLRVEEVPQGAGFFIAARTQVRTFMRRARTQLEAWSPESCLVERAAPYHMCLTQDIRAAAVAAAAALEAATATAAAPPALVDNTVIDLLGPESVAGYPAAAAAVETAHAVAARNTALKTLMVIVASSPTAQQRFVDSGSALPPVRQPCVDAGQLVHAPPNDVWLSKAWASQAQGTRVNGCCALTLCFVARAAPPLERWSVDRRCGGSSTQQGLRSNSQSTGYSPRHVCHA
jgi:hypothetical protein